MIDPSYAMSAEQSGDPLPRLLAGRYRLVASLRGAGMSSAYRAWDDEARCLVAVKIPGGKAGDDTFLRRFEQEARTAAALEHPHIVPVLDFGLADGRPYLVMPFLAGGTLAARLPQDGSGTSLTGSPAGLHQWLPAIAAALDHAHQVGVVHRDVKPANIFFNAEGGAYLGDFGIVKILAEAPDDDPEAGLTRTNLAVGTEYYMAPERFDRKPLVDGRADQYSLAVCVYELLAGRRPFRGDTAHIAVEHCSGPVPRLPESGTDVPDSLRAAVDRGLAKRPAERFASCADFASAVLADVPAPAAESGFLMVACPGCSRLLRFPVAASGRNGSCRACGRQLSIAADGSAVWPLGEDDPIPVVSAAAERPAARPAPHLALGRLALAAGIGLTGIALLMAWMLVPSRPTPAPQQEVAVVSAPPDQAPVAEVAEVVAPHETPSEPPPEPVPPPAKEPPPAAAPVAAVAMEEPPAPPANEPVAALAEDPAAAVAQADSGFLDEMHWVEVGDPGNAADTNGLGNVSQPFLLGRYELTNAEYCRFLNESVAGRENRQGLADGPISPSPTSGQAAILRHGEPGAFRYEVVTGMELMPVTELRWSDAARLANWLHNGGYPDADTESGAYPLDGLEPGEAMAVARQEGAKVWVPTRSEWYKAAFYKGGGEDAGYWKYPLSAHAMPKACSADEWGLGIPDGRSANFTRKSRWAGGYRMGDGGCLTAIGSNGPPGPYGTFDMAGNAAELVTLSAAEPGQPPVSVLCGGHAGSTAYAVLAADAPVSAGRGGVRLARAMPEAGAAVIRPPIEHLRTEAVPRPVLMAANALGRILEQVRQATRDDSTPEFFEKQLAAAAAVKDQRLPIAVRQLRDEVKALLAEAKTKAEAQRKALAQLQGAAGALRGFGLGQAVDELMAVDLRTVQADYDAAREPILTRAAALAARVQTLRADQQAR